MQIKDYWSVITKKWWVIVLIVIAAAGSAYLYSKQQQVIYRSSAKLYVMPARPDYGVTLVIQNTIRQYGQMIQTDRFLSKVIEDLKLDLAPIKLRSMISVSGTSDNLAIQIDVDDPDPGNAQRIARALALSFLENQQARMTTVEKTDRIDMEMFDNPEPGTLFRPQTRLNVIAGAVLGLILGGLFAFFLEYLDDTIKSAEDVERFVTLPVIGSIPTITQSEARRSR